MIEEGLLNYGALGLWTIANLYLLRWFMKKDDTRDKNMITVIENNTRTLAEVKTVIVKCIKK